MWYVNYSYMSLRKSELLKFFKLKVVSGKKGRNGDFRGGEGKGFYLLASPTQQS